MKNIDQSKVKLILPDDPGHGYTREKFEKLFRPERFAKIEAALKLPSPSEGFRQSLISFFWAFYINSLPEAEIKVSRAALKAELETAAELAEKLKTSAERIWASGNRTVIAKLSEFVPVSLTSQSMQPMHPSGIGFVGALDEFAKRTGWLADVLLDDAGGKRPAKSFEDLIIGLEDYHRQLASHGRLGSEDDFFQFMAAVVDVLLELASKLRAAEFDLPPNDVALRRRINRLDVKRRQARPRT
jgi:hypothetical protein